MVFIKVPSGAGAHCTAARFPESTGGVQWVSRRSSFFRGVRVVTRLVRDRDAGEAIVRETASRQAEIVVLGSPRSTTQSRVFGSTVDYVLRHAASRVMVAAAPRPATAGLRVAAS